MHKVIMFDYDGVIVDSRDVFCRACAEAFLAAGLPHLASEKMVLTLHEQNWFEALSESGVGEDVSQEIEDAIAQACAGNPDVKPFAEIPAVLAGLAHKSTLIIITASRTSVVQAFLRAHDIAGITRVMGSDVATSKTARIVQVKAEHGARAEYWYVGDTVGDIIEAKAAQVHTIGAGWGWHGPERLSKARPDFLLQSPAELLDVLLERRAC